MNRKRILVVVTIIFVTTTLMGLSSIITFLDNESTHRVKLNNEYYLADVVLPPPEPPPPIDPPPTDPPPPSYPVEYSVGIYADEYTLNDYTKLFGYAQIETEYYVVRLDVTLFSKSSDYNEQSFLVQAFYTYKGERYTNEPYEINPYTGVLDNIYIEVQEMYTNYQYHYAYWDIQEDNAQCWPSTFTSYQRSTWDDAASDLITKGITSAIGLVVAPSGPVGWILDMAVDKAVGTIVDGAISDVGEVYPHSTGYGTTDRTGDIHWQNMYPWGYNHYYGGTIGHQWAYDFLGQAKLRNCWRSWLHGDLIGLRFRVKANIITDVSGILGHDVVYTPWCTVWSTAY